MLHDTQLNPKTSNDTASVAEDVLQMQDRALPRWASMLSFLFSVTASCCLLSLALLAMLFQTMVATQGETLMAPVLVMVGIVPVLGALVLNYTHSRALAGYRQIREAHNRQVEAGVAGLAFLVLSFVHPLLGLGIALAAGLSAGGMWLLARAVREPLWDFNKAEAVGILAGRDSVGLRLAADKPCHAPLYRPLRRAIIWLSVMVSIAVATRFVGSGALNPATVLSVALITFWSAEAIARFALEQGPAGRQAAGVAERVEIILSEGTNDEQGLTVTDLSAQVPGGKILLSDLAFYLAPGSVTGVIGASGAGKTLLCQALVAPQDLAGMEVRGNVQFNGRTLWERHTGAQPLPALYLPDTPLLLPASGADNLSCYHDAETLERGKRHLEQLVFSAADAEQICATPDATRLPSGQRRALALARAFLLSPGLYVMDRPEDGASDQLVGAICAKIKHEKRLGRSFLIASDNRAILDTCDKLIVLEEGRMLDFGDAEQVRAKMSAGWARFVSGRSLESEDHLVLWIRNLFKRPGDDENRRNVALICAELLAFSCQSADSLKSQRITFEFKHFENYGVLRMIDQDDPLSSGQLERARREAEKASDLTRLSPLAAVMNAAQSVEGTVEGDQRVVTVKVTTYDPRKAKGAKPDAKPSG